LLSLIGYLGWAIWLSIGYWDIGLSGFDGVIGLLTG
jgi:hypothetical protein